MNTLANAGRDTGPDLNVMVVCLVVVGVVALFALWPMILGWQRKGSHRESLPPLATIWGVATAAVAVQALLAQAKWQAEWQLRVMSGYFNSTDTTGAPPLRWNLYGALAGWYVVMVLLGLRRGKVESLPPQEGPKA